MKWIRAKCYFHSPAKNALLFLLITVTTALLTASVALYQEAVGRIGAIESEFTTIGMVEQTSIATEYDRVQNDCLGKRTNVYSVFDEILSPDDLLFEGAGYLQEPEKRNYYLAYMPNQKYFRDGKQNFRNQMILTFIPLEASAGDEPVSAEVSSVLLNELDFSQVRFEQENYLQEGDHFTVCQHFVKEPIPLEAGKTYIMAAVKEYCSVHHQKEVVAYPGLYTSECTQDGMSVQGKIPSFLSMEQYHRRYRTRIDIVSGVPDFMNPVPSIEEIDTAAQLPAKWVSFALAQKELSAYFPVLATGSTNLLPTFHSGKAYIVQGRDITKEEYESGARVCLIPQEWTTSSWAMPWHKVGGKLSLPLICTLSGFMPDRMEYEQDRVQQRYSLLNASGGRYNTFSFGNYEVVGTYSLMNLGLRNSGKTELIQDLLIVPQKSIAGNDANFAYFAPMSTYTTSFQIENGTIESFDKALKTAVPKASLLNIVYDDNGYQDLKETLLDIKSAAILLLLVGVFAAAAMIAVFLFFFVVRQKRGIALMRSMGAGKAWCRASALRWVFLLSIAACVLGSALGACTLESLKPFHSNQETQAIEDTATDTYLGYDVAYSGWKDKLGNSNLLNEAVSKPIGCYILVPMIQFSVMLVSSIFLVNRYIHTDPIFLLHEAQE